MTVQERLEKLEIMISEMHAILTGNEARIDGVDMREYRKAIKALLAGDSVPLVQYKKRGGKIPVGDYER